MCAVDCPGCCRGPADQLPALDAQQRNAGGRACCGPKTSVHHAVPPVPTSSPLAPHCYRRRRAPRVQVCVHSKRVRRSTLWGFGQFSPTAPESGAVALAREKKCQQTVSGSESSSFALAQGRRWQQSLCASHITRSGRTHLHMSLAKIVAAAHFKAKMMKCEPINSWPPSVHTHTHSLSLSRARAHTHTHSPLSFSHSRSLAFSLSLSLSLTLSLSLSVSLCLSLSFVFVSISLSFSPLPLLSPNLCLSPFPTNFPSKFGLCMSTDWGTSCSERGERREKEAQVDSSTLRPCTATGRGWTPTAGVGANSGRHNFLGAPPQWKCSFRARWPQLRVLQSIAAGLQSIDCAACALQLCPARRW